MDTAVKFNEYKFLGKEFLTYLLYQSNSFSFPEKLRKADIDIKIDSVEIGDSVTIEGGVNGSKETVSIKGVDTGFEEALVAINKGGLIQQLKLKIVFDGVTAEFLLKSDELSVNSLKLDAGDADTENMEGAVIEKAYLTERVAKCVETCFKVFMKDRVSENWANETLPEMKSWVATQAG